LKKHEKHPKLNRPNIGSWGRNEFALVGAPCELINQIAAEIVSVLSGKYKIAFIDADHKVSESLKDSNITWLQDKISFFNISKKSLSDFDKRALLNDCDIILVNGNHFAAEKQIVLINQKKEESLKKRESQLTDIIAVLQTDETPVFDWLKIGNVPVLTKEKTVELAEVIEKNMKPVPLKGLVLVGGKSSRMGQNKSEIVYHEEVSQKDFLYKTLTYAGLETYLSVAVSQDQENVIPDAFLDMGPYGAILSAFKKDPNTAWLVLACDMPMIGKDEIDLLIQNRNTSKIATACHNPETNFPDPLFTIWEPKAYPVLLQFLSQGYSCPRKVLINSDIELVQLPNPGVLKNVNTPEELEGFKK
jgi:molybdopterin-guanine dinucleotide biosynthesis protein A